MSLFTNDILYKITPYNVTARNDTSATATYECNIHNGAIVIIGITIDIMTIIGINNFAISIKAFFLLYIIPIKTQFHTNADNTSPDMTVLTLIPNILNPILTNI